MIGAVADTSRMAWASSVSRLIGEIYTNSVGIENILIPSCNERNPCPQDRPF